MKTQNYKYFLITKITSYIVIKLNGLPAYKLNVLTNDFIHHDKHCLLLLILLIDVPQVRIKAYNCDQQPYDAMKHQKSKVASYT